MNVEKRFCENVFSFVAKPRVKATHSFLEGDDLGWGAPGLGDDLGWGGEATRDAQGCGGGPLPLGLLERDIIINTGIASSNVEVTSLIKFPTQATWEFQRVLH